MRRTVLALFILAVSVSCGVNPSRGPLSPSAVGAGNGAGSQQAGVSEVSWACMTGSAECDAAVPAQYPVTGRADALGPTSFNFVVTGQTVVLTWVGPTDVTPVEYQIEAGTGSGLSNIIVFRTGNIAQGIVVSNVPFGTYFARIRAIVAGNVATEPSNEIVVVVSNAPCTNSVNPTTINAPSAGITTNIAVTSNCNWTATSAAPFVTITSGSVGAGNGTVTISVAPNAGGSRTGVLAIAGQAVTVNQAAGSLSASFQLRDPATQTGATTECRIRGNPSTCELRSTSFTFGRNAIVSEHWTIQYTYGVVKTVTFTGDFPTVNFSDTCGGEGSTAEGALQPLSVTLTVTDDLGATATATTGVGSQPPLFLRLYTCPS